MENMVQSVLSDLRGLDVQSGVPLSLLTSFRIGGPAALVAHPHTEEELLAAVAACGRYGLPYRVLGNGTNVLAPDEGYEGMILRLSRPFFESTVSQTTLRCPAGLPLSSAVRLSVLHGLMGLEGMEGIPGTVGGACAMNAGAFGAETSQFLRRVRVIRDGALSDVTVREGDLGHRTSAFAAPRAIVVAAEFELLPDDGTAKERMERFALRRAEKQPLSFPSAGSVFKRPAGHFAGGLIEQCGLKGEAVGGAQVSVKHAGFIVNTGGATCADVAALIRRIQQRVFEETGVSLERELKFWHEI